MRKWSNNSYNTDLERRWLDRPGNVTAAIIGNSNIDVVSVHRRASAYRPTRAIISFSSSASTASRMANRLCCCLPPRHSPTHELADFHRRHHRAGASPQLSERLFVAG
jgi:hypothetical protein